MANTKKKTTKKATPKVMSGTKGGSAIMSGVAGAAIGAAVGGIAGIALSDEKTRKKVSALASEAKNLAADTMEKNKVEMPSHIDLPKKSTKSAKTKN